MPSAFIKRKHCSNQRITKFLGMFSGVTVIVTANHGKNNRDFRSFTYSKASKLNMRAFAHRKKNHPEK